MSIKIGKYTIKKADDLQFSLHETKAKGSFRGKQAEGNKDELIGYYGYLSIALNKIVNLTALETVGDDNISLQAKELLEAISTLETHINNAYKFRPKDEDETLWSNGERRDSRGSLCCN